MECSRYRAEWQLHQATLPRELQFEHMVRLPFEGVLEDLVGVMPAHVHALVSALVEKKKAGVELCKTCVLVDTWPPSRA